MKNLPTILFIALLSAWTANAAAFEIDGSKWFGARALLYINIPGIAGTGASFNSAFTYAINEWNDKTSFTFSMVPQSRDPCLNDGLNGVGFAADLCGSAFGGRTLAVTVRRFRNEVLGPNSIAQADIVINQAESFNVYDGPLIQFGINGLDLKRIAVHELGHVLGLEHSTSSQAIMAPNIGNVFQLSADDIGGVETLYGGLSKCTVRKFTFGVISNALDKNDCTVDQLTVGKSDSSPIDVYQFDIANTTTFNFSMTSAKLDSVLLVADRDLRVVAHDDKSSKQCNSALSATLQPGTYYLLANTYNVVLNPGCGITGSYQITTSYTSNSFLSFKDAESLSGGPAFGAFSGGITANNGVSYGNRFKSTDKLDIHARVEIDKIHQGQAGFLVVAATIAGTVYLLDSKGHFIPFNSKSGPVLKAKTTVFSTREDLQIATGLVPASLGISNIEVDFAIGYGLDSNPGEVYFHTTPLHLTVSP